MERDEALIEAVCSYPCLYNCRLADFKIQLKKENAWTSIGEQLERSVEDCQKRWKTLRERFVKEMKKKVTKSGQGAVSGPQWELLQQMSFIREFIKHRKSDGNMQSDPVTEGETEKNKEEESTAMSSTPTPPPSSRSSTPLHSLNRPLPSKKKRACQEELQLDREMLAELRKEQQSAPQLDQDDHFGRSIGAELKLMTLHQKVLAKLRIRQIMYEVQYCTPVGPPSRFAAEHTSPFPAEHTSFEGM